MAGVPRTNPDPVTVIEVRFRVARPVLVTVMLCVLVEPMGTLPRFNVVAGTPMPGTAIAAPVPESEITCGLPGALLVMVTLPVSAATVSGVKVMLMLQFAAAVSGGVRIGQVLVKPKSPLLVMLLMTRLAVPLLVSVMSEFGLVVLTVRLPKATVGGARVTAGAGAAVTVILNGVALLLPAGVTTRPARILPE